MRARESRDVPALLAATMAALPSWARKQSMSAPPLDRRNVNSLWASVLVETLARGGVRHAIVSPGSRSTPLAFAFAAHAEIEAIPVLDERSAAFFALGLAKQR